MMPEPGLKGCRPMQLGKSPSSPPRSPLLALGLLAFAQVILRRARMGARRGAVGVEVLLGYDGNAAVVAHLDEVESLAAAALVHPVLVGEPGRHPLDRALDAERLAAADAAERLLLLEEPRGGRGGA